MTTQTEQIYSRFGGPAKLIEALQADGHEVNETTVYRWSYEKERGGTGGHIPPRWIPHIQAAARARGIELTPDDWYQEQVQ